MREDPIVAAVRKARREHTDRFHGDLHAICEDLRRQERESGRDFVPLQSPDLTAVAVVSGEDGGQESR
jgi:hypothetical protein